MGLEHLKVNRLKEVDIEDLDLEATYFHFTNQQSESSIAELGLEPRSGINSYGLGREKTKKVFFSKGNDSVLILINRLLNYAVGMPTSKIPTNYRQYCKNIDLNNSERVSKSEAFEFAKNYLQDSIYLSLDLKEGVDYFSYDIDEESGKPIYLTPYNLHTPSDTGISANKISKIIANEKQDALSIVNNIYNKYKSNTNDKTPTCGGIDEPLLEEFMDYIKEKDITNEQVLNHDQTK